MVDLYYIAELAIDPLLKEDEDGLAYLNDKDSELAFQLAYDALIEYTDEVEAGNIASQKQELYSQHR
jgi:hypothetical protein